MEEMLSKALETALELGTMALVYGALAALAVLVQYLKTRAAGSRLSFIALAAEQAVAAQQQRAEAIRAQRGGLLLPEDAELLYDTAVADVTKWAKANGVKIAGAVIGELVGASIESAVWLQKNGNSAMHGGAK